jgi:hypothetical protein
MSIKKKKHNKDSQIFVDNILVFENRNREKSFDDHKIVFRFTHVEQKYLDCQYKKKKKTKKKKNR